MRKNKFTINPTVMSFHHTFLLTGWIACAGHMLYNVKWVISSVTEEKGSSWLGAL